MNWIPEYGTKPIGRPLKLDICQRSTRQRGEEQRESPAIARDGVISSPMFSEEREDLSLSLSPCISLLKSSYYFCCSRIHKPVCWRIRDQTGLRFAQCSAPYYTMIYDPLSPEDTAVWLKNALAHRDVVLNAIVLSELTPLRAPCARHEWPRRRIRILVITATIWLPCAKVVHWQHRMPLLLGHLLRT